MAKKNFDNLVNNMLSPAAVAPVAKEPETVVEAQNGEVAESKVQRGRPVKNTESVENFCGRADSTKLAKIRAVAEKENVPIKDLYNLAFDLFITAYEEKTGQPIKVKPKQIKGDASSLI